MHMAHRMAEKEDFTSESLVATSLMRLACASAASYAAGALFSSPSGTGGKCGARCIQLSLAHSASASTKCTCGGSGEVDSRRVSASIIP